MLKIREQNRGSSAFFVERLFQPLTSHDSDLPPNMVLNPVSKRSCIYMESVDQTIISGNLFVS
jgi:hypothetical protein